MANRNLIKIIDLGFHPYADTFIKKKDLNKSEPVFRTKKTEQFKIL